ALARGRIASDGGRLMHILWYAELRGVLCSGAPRDKQQTFALFDERVPPARVLEREQSLAQLAERYFRSRGPATDRDFSWWSGLGLGEVRQAIALARPRLCRVELDGSEYWSAADPARSTLDGIQLLPAFDECLIGYQDRAAFVEAAHVRKINAGGGILKPIVMLAGRAVGTWRRTVAKGTASVVARPFRRLAAHEREALAAAIDRYAAFVGPP
ncbi:MAG: DNA glycosylase AlkZ-like family protein, partial [Xanthobacteraceae bacterium]